MSLMERIREEMAEHPIMYLVIVFVGMVILFLVLRKADEILNMIGIR